MHHRWRHYAEDIRQHTLEPVPPPPFSPIANSVRPTSPGNSGPNEAKSFHGRPSPESRQYLGYGPALPLGLKGVHTKAPFAERKYVWAALNIGGHQPPPLKSMKPEVNVGPYFNGKPFYPAKDVNKFRPNWNAVDLNILLRDKLYSRSSKPSDMWKQFGRTASGPSMIRRGELRESIDQLLTCTLTDQEARSIFNFYAASADSETVNLQDVIVHCTRGGSQFAAPGNGGARMAQPVETYAPKWGSPKASRSKGRIGLEDLEYTQTPSQHLRFNHYITGKRSVDANKKASS